MIQYIKHNDIDKNRWDACVRSSANGRIYAYSWYLDRVTGHAWDALVEDDYCAVFPLPVKIKAGITYTYTPFFVQQLGLFTAKPQEPILLRSLLGALPKHFKLVDLNLNTGNTLEHFQSTHGFRCRLKPNFELLLNNSYEALHKGFADNIKRNIKKTEREELVFCSSISVEHIISLFREERGKKITNWGDDVYNLFEKLTEDCRLFEKVEIREAYDKAGDFLAGAVFFITEARAVFIFSATGEQAKSSAAMPGIINRFIKDHAGESLLLDFEGSSDPGLARFYAGFGSQKTSYAHLFRDQTPLPIRLLRRAKQNFRHL
jgi:hypothetical protein